MLIGFILSMPGCGSWNGKWTGDGQFYAKVRDLERKKGLEILEEGYFRYDFGDGWAAGINVRELSASEADDMRERSKGFCGYEWMIDSICSVGRIEVKTEA